MTYSREEKEHQYLDRHELLRSLGRFVVPFTVKRDTEGLAPLTPFLSSAMEQSAIDYRGQRRRAL